MKKTILAILLLIVLCFTGCDSKNLEADFDYLYNRYLKYDVDWMMGKTSKEIIEQYGQFDMISNYPDEDGLYKNVICGYTLRERTPGFLDAIEEKILFIYFDENGIAESYDWNGYRKGG